MTLLKYSDWLLNISRDAGDKHFNPKTQLCLIPRDTVWYAISLLFDDSEERRAFGNSILENIQCDDGTHTPATMLAILQNIPERITEKAKENLYHNIKRGLVHSAEVEWHDGNVNHPLAAWCTLICGGELCNESWATEIGYQKLHAFQQTIGDRHHRIRRQSEMSEYNSLTYTALDLWFLAIIAEHAQLPDAKKLALFLEQRLWIDVAMHFHAPSNQFAGPHSRSYQTDSTGGYSALHCTMLAAFEDEIYLNPELAIQHNHASDLIENSLIAILKFHVPELARKIAWQKPFPYYFQKTTYCEQYHENIWKQNEADREAPRLDQSSLDITQAGNNKIMIGDRHSEKLTNVHNEVKNKSKDELPFAFDDEVYHGGWSDLTTFMTQEYTLGTASTPYVNAGHADSFMLRIKRADKIKSLQDFRSAYTRGVFNGAMVGQTNYCHITKRLIDESYLYEEGRCAAYQHRNSAIVCYTPKRAGHAGVSSFRLDLIFGYFSPFDKLIIDDQEVTTFPLLVKNESQIFFQDHHTFGVIIPLRIFPVCSATPIALRTVNNHLMISFYNYNDDARDFTRDEINRWRNGFVIELAAADEYKTFQEFVTRKKNNSVLEIVHEDAVRHITHKSASNTMEMIYDPFREKILSRKWNGVEECIDHLHVDAAGRTDGEFCPKTIFGSEAMNDV